MKRFSEQLKKKSNSIRLSAAEKRDLRDQLFAYMEYHPLPENLARTNSLVSLAEPFKVFHIPANYIRLAAGLAAVFVFIVMPSLAEKTVPGDILYPVKGLTEDIRGSLNLSPYEKVAWETKRLERRVAEARLLAKEGKLTPEVEADMLAAVQGHKSAAEAQIKSLQTTDSEGAGLAQMTFSSVLDVQTAILRSDTNASTTVGTLSDALTTVLESGREDDLTQGQTAAVSFERLMAQLEIETTRTYELLTSNASVATESEQNDTKRRLTDLESRISEAAGKHDTDPEASVVELRAVWSDLQKLIAFMTDINVRSSVSIESLVPIVLTNEERKEIFANRYEILQADVLRLNSALEQIEDPTVTDKIALSLSEVDELIAVATSSLATSSLGEAEKALFSARSLVDSILSVAGLTTEVVDVIPNEPIINSTTTTSTSTDSDSDPAPDDEVILNSSTTATTDPTTKKIAG